MSDIAASCIPCGLQTFRRNTYFNGKLLTERDFADEQAYLVGKDRLHNALLHGAGTVCGLSVSAHPNEDCRRRYLVIEPGMALDCCGREIVVPQRTVIDVQALIAEQGLVLDPAAGQDLFIRLCYKEFGDERVPAILPDCSCSDGDTAFNRIKESFRVSLDVQRSGARPEVRPHAKARLDWVQTLVLQGQEVTATAFDEENGQIYIATRSDGGGARMLVYDADTHDLITSVETGTLVNDLAISPRGDLIYAAGQGIEGADGLAIYREADIRGNDPAAPVIPIAGAMRLTVSGDGTVFVLALDTGDIFAWQESSIQDWLTAGAPAGRPANRRRFALGHAVGAAAPMRRGANAMAVSADGRLLFVLDVDATDPDQRLRIVDVSRLFSGAVDGEPGDEITVDVALSGAPIALAIAFDRKYAFVLTQIDAETAGLDRFRLSNDGGIFAVTREGRGGAWPATALDLTLAPGETWAYSIEADGDRSSVVSLSVDAISSLDADEPVNPVGTSAGIAGAARFQRLSAGLNRLYVAALDTTPEAQPDRGLVAVIDVREDDCGGLFDRVIGPCASCADDDHCVTLAHLPSYVAGTPMQNDGQGDDDDLHIDNLTHRLLVPSTNTIVDVVRCMLDKGVGQGRPGPRGPAGLPGRDGVDGQDGQDGTDGQNGRDGQNGTNGLDGRPGRDGRDGQDGEGLTEELTHITNVSWLHDQTSFGGFGEFDARLRELGIVLLFDRPIAVATVLGNNNSRRHSRVFELLGRVPAMGGLVEVITLGLICEPCEVTSIDGGGRINGATSLPLDTAFARAVRLRFERETPRPPGQLRADTFRVVFRADFVRDERGFAVDGDHIFGAVPSRPTGDRLQGGTFESWFDIAQ